MKKIFFLLLLGFSLAACAGAPGRMVGDQGSAAKVALLKERAEEYWTATVKENYERTFYLYDPFFQTIANKYTFLANRGAVKYHSFEIKDVKVEGNVGHVTVKIVYSVPKRKFKTQEFSKPETPAEFEETWLFVYDNWYKEYKTDEESGIVRY